jgi:hypothetical protein
LKSPLDGTCVASASLAWKVAGVGGGLDKEMSWVFLRSRGNHRACLYRNGLKSRAKVGHPMRFGLGIQYHSSYPHPYPREIASLPLQ